VVHGVHSDLGAGSDCDRDRRGAVWAAAPLGAARCVGWWEHRVHGTEPVQGRATRVGTALRDLRRRRTWSARRVASAVRGACLALRGAPVARVPHPPGGAGPGGVALAGLAGVGGHDPAPVACARDPRRTPLGAAPRPGSSWVLLVAPAARRGRGGLRPGGAARGGHRAPAAPGRPR